ncbi:MAG: hypothetical protein J3R72DRAFT_479942 [Linnemannia gamsii]|nr:MAG: hypothetical protein J3R72DRAFT_479942 [Linnemannia gamsii]
MSQHTLFFRKTPLTNSFKRAIIHKDNLTPTTPGTVAYIAVQTDTSSSSSSKTIILWDDVLQASKDALHVRHGAVILPFLKDPDFKNLTPLRFAAVPGVVLNIVIKGPLVETTTLSSQETTQEAHVQGDVEAAMENYIHIDRPNINAPGPQFIPDDHNSHVYQSESDSLTNLTT